VPIAVGTGLAITVFGGGLALAYDGGGTPSAAPSVVRPVLPSVTATPSASGTRISRAAAERIALRAVPGGRIRSVELEPEHGRLVWKVDVITANGEHGLYIDAQTGKLVRDTFKRNDNARRDNARRDNARRGDDGRGDDRRGAEGRHGSDDPPGDDHGDD
jgi:hypothetical protein